MKRCLGLALFVLALSGANAAATVTSPRAFDDDYDAALAVSGDTQWLIVGGVDGRGSHETYGVKAFQRSGTGSWSGLPTLPGKGFNSSFALQAAVQGAADPHPCFLYPLDAGPRLECLRDGGWRSAVGKGLKGFAGANVEDLIAPTPDSLALAYLRVFERQDRVLTYVARSGSGGRWQRVGKPMEGVMIAQFDRSDTPGALRLGIETMHNNAAKRYIAESSGGRWEPVSPIDHAPAGPFVGGPITIAGSSFFPFTNAVTGPFTFGVLSLAPGATGWSQVGGAELSDPAAAGQGSVGIADGGPWAIWQEDTQRGHAFNSVIRLADLAGAPVTPIALWSGKRGAPGPVDLVDGPGSAMYALYAQGTRMGLRVVIEDITS